MTDSYQPARSEEADRLVSEFLDQIIARNASGNAVSAMLSIKEIKSILSHARFPTIPDDLRESLYAVAMRARNVDPSFESELLTRYLALPYAIQFGASEAYRQRLAALSPIGKLKLQACKPDDHPTEATLVAKMYMDGHLVAERDGPYVLRLLNVAAHHGNAEAAYLLATAESSVMHDGDSIGSVFLIGSDYHRKQYLRQARAGNFKKVFDEEANAQYDADDDNEDRLHDLQEKLAHDEACAILEGIVDETETITPMDWMFVGETYLKHAKHIEEEYEWLLRHCADTREQVSNLRNLAERWLRKAAGHETRACFLLAENFCALQEERFSLLKSAAFPGMGVSGYLEAASPLACEFLMNPKSEHFDAEVGEHCLRDYLASCQPGQSSYLLLDDTNAANCLADWLLALPAPTTGQKAEAFAWYRRAAESEFGLGSSHALIRAGLMALRGDGCPQDHDLAETFLRKARRAFSDQSREKRASKYADIVLRLGWKTWALVAEELFELAEETEFLGDPLCPLTPEDVGILVARNPRFRPRSSDDELRALRGRLDYPCGPFGEFPIHRLIIEGLVWALQPSRNIPRERLAELWDHNRSMVESYAWSRLELASRIDNTGIATSVGRVRDLLARVTSLGNEMLADKYREPLKFGERELVLSITRQASATLNHLQKQREIEETAKHEADAHIKVLAERTRLLSALSHTLHNSQVTSRQLVRSAVEILGRMTSLTILEEKAVNDLLSLHAKFDFTNNLIQTYKLLASEPEKLAAESMAEQPGLPPIGGVVVEALQNALMRVVFEQSYEARAYHLMEKRDYRALLSLRAAYRTQPFFADDPGSAGQFLDWIRSCFPKLQVDIASEAFGRPLHNITQRALVFSIVSELVANAMNYGSEQTPISISLTVNRKVYALKVRNGYSGTDEIKKGNGGLAFINDLSDKLTVPGYFDARFIAPEIANGVFCASLVMTDERI